MFRIIIQATGREWCVLYVLLALGVILSTSLLTFILTFVSVIVLNHPGQVYLILFYVFNAFMLLYHLFNLTIESGISHLWMTWEVEVMVVVGWLKKQVLHTVLYPFILFIKFIFSFDLVQRGSTPSSGGVVTLWDWLVQQDIYIRMFIGFMLLYFHYFFFLHLLLLFSQIRYRQTIVFTSRSGRLFWKCLPVDTHQTRRGHLCVSMWAHFPQFMFGNGTRRKFMWGWWGRLSYLWPSSSLPISFYVSLSLFS